VGFYGGVNYGGGYTGEGYAGGRWERDHFRYNTAVNNVNTTRIHNTYNQTVINNITVNKVSYNGGAGGVAAVPTAQERDAARELHVAPTPMQHQHVQEAARNPALAARANGGHPAIAATPKPAAFNAPGVVGARGAPPRTATTQPVAGAGGGRNAAMRPPVTNGQPPAGYAHPQAQAANVHGQAAAVPPQAPKAQPKQQQQQQRAKPAKNDKHEPQGGNK
jgi:hypothetical protein